MLGPWMYVQPDNVRNEILTGDVRDWPLADIAICTAHVCF